MPRKPRIHIDDGFYHVLSRGNNKQEIFFQPSDYTYYLSILDKYGPLNDVTLHAYVLMPNHVHLIVQTGSTPLAKFMQVVQQTYAQGFNRRYDRVGHVFQGRYKAPLIEDDAYLLALIRYIHLNPVRAHLCTDPLQYPWSSHHHYMTGRGPGLVTTTFVESILATFGGKTIDDYELLPEAASLEDARPLPEKPAAAVLSENTVRAGLPAVLNTVADVTNVDAASITGSLQLREVVRARRLFIYCATRLAGHRAAQVAQFLGRSDSYVTMAANSAAEIFRRGDRDWETATEAVKQKLGVEPD